MQSVTSAKTFKNMIQEPGFMKLVWSILPGATLAALVATVTFQFSNFQNQIKSTIILESIQESSKKRDSDFESLRDRVDRITTDIAELKVEIRRDLKRNGN